MSWEHERIHGREIKQGICFCNLFQINLNFLKIFYSISVILGNRWQILFLNLALSLVKPLCYVWFECSRWFRPFKHWKPDNLLLPELDFQLRNKALYNSRYTCIFPFKNLAKCSWISVLLFYYILIMMLSKNFQMLKEFVLISLIKPDVRKTLNFIVLFVF